MFIPARLTLARKRRGFTVTRLAEKVGLTPQSLSNAERGRQDPSDSTLKAISEVLNFPVSFFLEPEPTSVVAEQVSFRARTKTSARARDAALSAATIAVELHTWIDHRFQLPLTDIPTVERKMSPEIAAAHVRARWGISANKGIANMVHTLEARGVAIYSLPPEYSDVDAFSFWLDGQPFVLLNTLKSAERGRFDCAHELGHLVMHGQIGCDEDSRAKEREANSFGSAFLMPKESVQSFIKTSPTVDEIIRYKKKWRVSALALTYRLHDLGIMSDWGYRRAVIELGKIGFRSEEPGGLARETSHVLHKVLSNLRSVGVSFSKLSTELHIPQSELNELMFRLAVVPVSGSASLAGSGTAEDSQVSRRELRSVPEISPSAS